MICPFDATALQVVNRSGVEIDWCPSCKGVWLERGELDKLIDEASRPELPGSGRSGRPVPEDRRDDRWDDDRRHRRKSLLSEIFDF